MGYTADSLRYKQKLTQHCKTIIFNKIFLKIALMVTIMLIFKKVIIIFFYQELPNINHCNLPIQTV